MLAALVVLAVLAPLPAHAHGGPPAFETVVVDPTDARRILASTNFGLALSRDGGATWGWICPAAVGLRSDIEDPVLDIGHDGTLWIGDGAGLWRSAPLGCDWAIADPVFDGMQIGAIARGAPHVLFVGTSSFGTRGNALFRSGDDGAAWAPVLGPDPSLWYESVRASADGTRVYAIQNRPPVRTEPWQSSLFRSDDGGLTFVEHPFALDPQEWRLFLLGVDPTAPDRVLARTQNLMPGGHERVLVSEDGGATWTEVLQLVAALAGGWAQDGSAAWVGGPVDALFRADDSGHTFAPSHPPPLTVRSLLPRPAGEIWVVADDYGDGFGVGRSTDRGVSFTPFVRLRDVGAILACDPASTVGTTCPPHQAMLDTVLSMAPGGDAGVLDVDGGPRLDAGAGPPRPAPSCGCAIGRRRPVAHALALLALVLARRRLRHR